MNIHLNIENLNLLISNQLLLTNFNLSLNIGERIGLTGPSGCGKSTLLKSIISGKFPTSSSFNAFSKSEIKKIGYVPQTNGLLPWFSIKKQLSIFSQKPNHINEVATNLKINLCMNNFPDEISGGEAQRSLLCCSILSNPDLYIADEPLTEVDLELKWRILKYWSKIIFESKSSLLIVSHDLDTLTYMCDKIIVLSEKPSKIIKILEINNNHPRDFKEILNSSARIEILNKIISEV